MATRLILFEGIPGSGKTTFAKKAASHLKRKSIPHTLFLEGGLHPANLDGYAVMPSSMLNDTLARYPKNEAKVRRHLITKGEYTLIQRQKVLSAKSPLYQHLESFAVWGGGLDFELFVEMHLDRWRDFSRTRDNEVTVFECAFLQDHTTELMLNYKKTEAEILEYFLTLEECILELEPILIYLSQDKVEETIEKVANERINRGGGVSWADRVSQMVEDSPYGKANQLAGYDGMITFFKNRREIDLSVLDGLAMMHVVVNNELGHQKSTWEQIRREINDKIET